MITRMSLRDIIYVMPLSGRNLSANLIKFPPWFHRKPNLVCFQILEKNSHLHNSVCVDSQEEVSVNSSSLHLSLSVVTWTKNWNHPLKSICSSFLPWFYKDSGALSYKELQPWFANLRYLLIDV